MAGAAHLSLVLFAALSIATSQLSAQSGGCAQCHAEIAANYARTGMGRSFSRLTAQTNRADFLRENTFLHEASDRYYEAVERGGLFYLRRWQQDAEGRRFNLVEKRIDYALGSGNHAVGFLHRTPDGRLLQLPLSWYSANGGYWAMAPGYDRPDHADFRRDVDLECLFCHNAYPDEDRQEIPDAAVRFSGELPEGVDCARCHGVASGHAEAARRGDAAAVRSTVLNPARLSRERSLEVCMQCHLETTTNLLPHALRRSGRGYFSYDPAEPLADYVLHFDHAAGQEDKFEVVSAVYRLRQSKCFARSPMTCTTCHDPHHIERGAAGRERHNAVCKSCHETKLADEGVHVRQADCVACHMPQRVADDALHVRMTDHRILARPLVAAEPAAADETGGAAYQGPVALYYPDKRPRSPNFVLDLALAQVKDFANLSAGLPALAQAIERFAPRDPRYSYFLGEGLRRQGRATEAARAYRAALSVEQSYWPAGLGLGLALAAAGDLDDAATALAQAFVASGVAVAVAVALADVHYRLGRLEE
ncbi:MAG: tetratricopeptide repeat protein, partial [Acidobacteria bacterium]|nr:tetratricopeptide repeat protein [Acidobacteriota bacterium]